MYYSFRSIFRYIELKYRISTGRLRILPDFLIIGAQKAGTTSLYNYLIKHPYIKGSFRKEVNYFDLNYSKGLNWYRSFFPTKVMRFFISNFTNKKCISGEGSTFYLLHPYAAKRVYELLPHIKIIVLLRNPVNRTFSGYSHSVNTGSESLSFEEAIEKEDIRIKGEIEKIRHNPNYRSTEFPGRAYKTRSIYVNQLKIWLNYFPKEQFMFIKSEDFFEDPQKILYEVFRFLNIPKFDINKFKVFMAETKGKKMNEDFKNKLKEFFKPYNQQLYELLERDFEWDD
jgi:hypothetical protein